MRKLCALALVFAGCGSEAATKFPKGLEPLAGANVAPEPTGPEGIAFANGKSEDGIWVHAKATVRAPLATVWKALQDPEVCVDRRKVASWTATQNVVAGVRNSHRLHYVVQNVVTVEFDITWRMDVVGGTATEPEVVAARFEKTDGTWYISSLAGSVIARQVEDDVTSLEFVELLDAVQEDPQDIQSFLTDLHASVVARAHGKPLPTY